MTKSDEGKTVSYWEASENLIEKDSLRQSIETDICIIGGGISGLTTAYLLTKAGRQVIIIDDGTIGGGETSRTTAHLSNALDDRIYRIEDWHGEEKAKLAVEAVFEPSRLATQSIKEAIPEIVSSTVPYVDWITGGDVSSVDEIKNGEGAIIRQGASKIAAYRDENGKLYQRSAVCVHLGCIVRFNSLEKTWDCPCHGSRYGIDGHPINAPAISPLGEIEESSNQ